MSKENKNNLLVLSFFLGGTLGGLWETIYTYLVRGVFEWKSGIMFFPLCNPIYGLGAVLITYYALRNKSSLSIYIFSVVACSLAEYVCSYFEEAIFNTISWDYSTYLLNINGRVNLLYSLFWGLLGVVYAKLLLPRISSRVTHDGLLYQDISYILIVIYSLFAFYSLLGVSYVDFNLPIKSAALDNLFNQDVVKFFYPTRVLA